MKQPYLLSSAIRLESLWEVQRNSPALITDSGVMSFGEVGCVLHDLTIRLREAGVRRGERVALYAPSSEIHLYLFLAAWVMDFLYMPLDYKTPLMTHLAHKPIDHLVTNEAVGSQHRPPILQPFKLLRPAKADDPEKGPSVPFRREVCVLFTSGSTGQPKGVVLTVGNFIHSALGTNEAIGLKNFDSWLLSLPLFHAGGVLIWVRSLLGGAACVLTNPDMPLDAAIARFRPSVLSLVPTQLIRLLDENKVIARLRQTKAILLGGAPPPGWLIDRSLDLGLPIMPTYGSTESCAQVTGVPMGSSRQAYHTAGVPLRYRSVCLAKDKTILLGGRTLFRRYLQDDTPRRSRFFATADHGHFDPDGNLVVLGRKDGVFISGGENIQPAEIENALLIQEGVAAAFVVPVSHREFGLTPWAFVETRQPLDEKKMIEKLRAVLPGYKIPKRILPLIPEDRLAMKYSRPLVASRAAVLAEKERKHACITSLHYEEEGRPDAPVLVFLHGFMGRAASFGKIIKPLSESWRCLAFDLPGHGASLFAGNDRLVSLQNMDDLAGLILEDLDALGIRSFSLYGYSMGGRVAQHIALIRPDCVQRLILESASFGIADRQERASRYQRDRKLLSGIKSREAFYAFLCSWYRMPMFITLAGTAHRDRLIKERLAHPIGEYQKALDLMSIGLQEYLLESLACCDGRLLYLCGAQDPEYVKIARNALLLHMNMKVRIFPGASHNIHVQCPRRIVSAIRRFML